MAQIGEAIAVGLFRPLKDDCPFKDEEVDEPSDEEPENVEKDDRDSVIKEQENSGGTLGENLSKGGEAGWGSAKTINKIYPPLSSIRKLERVDSKEYPESQDRPMVNVESLEYPYKLAAHHLIPGTASLVKSQLYKCYMKRGAILITISGQSYKSKCHIGYNVNGNHNGMWLPGNHGIREGSSKKEKTWSELVDDPDEQEWCYKYMMACVKKAGGQFHDSHTSYNEAVLDLLNNFMLLLMVHQDSDCEYCKAKAGGEVYPPFVIKARLYVLSRYLRTKLSTAPGNWKMPWCTSDKFKEILIKEKKLLETH